MLYFQCRSCHSLAEEEGHLVGTKPDNPFESVAGTRENFVYSDAIAESRMVLSEETLNAVITRPNRLFPSTKMAFAAITDPSNWRLLVDYIRRQTSEQLLAAGPPLGLNSLAG